MKNAPLTTTAIVRRPARPWTRFASLLALLVAAAPAAADGTSANGPVSLAAAAPAPAPATAPATAPAPATASVVDPDPEPAAPPAHETRALGTPNGLFSARPASETGAEDEDVGPLGALDPRRNDMTRLGLALALVIGLAVAVRLVFRRFSGVLGGGGRPAGVMEILARYPVARGQSVVLLKVARRVLVVHHGGNGMTTLSEITEPDEVAQLLARMESGSRARDAVKFRSTLRNFEREHEQLAAESSDPGAGIIEVVDLTRPARRVTRHPSRRRLTA
ncbi:MAG: FliO/MopB family protein [Planctomycetes bacterium]|nr:FliO/MopB family protein [Planctomycetota bacterium]